MPLLLSRGLLIASLQTSWTCALLYTLMTSSSTPRTRSHTKDMSKKSSNASANTITGILSVTCSNRELHPVAFYSHTLTTLELNYDTHNKELLAIYEAFHHW